jgi:hypothetical protein
MGIFAPHSALQYATDVEDIMGNGQDKRTDDWLKEVTFPRGKKSASDALWDAFAHPSIDNFLKLLDVSAVDQVERGLKNIFGKAIDQTKSDVEQRVSDPTLRSASLDDLSRMKGEMEKKTTFAFKSIYSLGDLSKLTQPIPDSVLKATVEKDKAGKKDDETAILQGPEPKTVIDSRYRFFDRPRFTLQLGGVDKAMEKGDAKELRLQKIGLTWRIAEMTSLEEPAKADPEGGSGESPAGQHEVVAGESNAVQKSDLTIGLSANDLVPGKSKNQPSLELDLNYKMQIGNRAVIELGADDRFGHGIRDLKLTFNFKVDF